MVDLHPRRACSLEASEPKTITSERAGLRGRVLPAAAAALDLAARLHWADAAHSRLFPSAPYWLLRPSKWKGLFEREREICMKMS